MKSHGLCLLQAPQLPFPLYKNVLLLLWGDLHEAPMIADPELQFSAETNKLILGEVSGSLFISGQQNQKVTLRMRKKGAAFIYRSLSCNIIFRYFTIIPEEGTLNIYLF